MTLEQPAFGARVVADPCGAIHLLYSVLGEGGVPVLRYRRWSGEWTDELPFPETPVAIDPALGLLPTGEPVAAWSTVTEPDVAGRARATTVFAVLERTCSRER